MKMRASKSKTPGMGAPGVLAASKNNQMQAFASTFSGIDQSRSPIIVITPDPFGYGFDVEVIPPPEGVGHNREFQTYPAAFGYATYLSATHGWGVRDLVRGAEE